MTWQPIQRSPQGKTLDLEENRRATVPQKVFPKKKNTRPFHSTVLFTLRCDKSTAYLAILSLGLVALCLLTSALGGDKTLFTTVQELNRESHDAEVNRARSLLWITPGGWWGFEKLPGGEAQREGSFHASARSEQEEGAQPQKIEQVWAEPASEGKDSARKENGVNAGEETAEASGKLPLAEEGDKGGRVDDDKGAEEERIDEGLSASPPLSAYKAPSRPASEQAQPPLTLADLQALLARHVSFPGSQRCGRWADEYASLHRSIREGAEGVPRKYLTYEPPPGGPGMGDRLNGVVSAFLVALLTNRAFVLADTRLAAAFDPAEIDWRPSTDVPLPDERTNTGMLQEGSVVRVMAANGVPGVWPHCEECEGMVWDILPNMTGSEPASNIILHANRGILSQIFVHPESETYIALHDKGMRLPSAFACILRFLMKPNDEVARRALVPMASLRRLNTAKICIHARTNDALAWAELNEGNETKEGLMEPAQKLLGELENCAQAVEDYWIPGGVNATWLFISDSDDVRRLAISRHPNKVMVPNIKPQHVKSGGRRSLVTTSVDWLLFTMCDFYVIVNSGLSKTAFAYNLNTPPLYLFDRIDYGEGLGYCNPPYPLSVMDLSSWSGL